MKKSARFLSVFLVIALCMSFFPASVYASEDLSERTITEKPGSNISDPLRASEIITGSCGEEAVFALNRDTAELTISGTGDMSHWDSTEDVPWSAYWDDIQMITVLDGVTSISQYAFSEIWEVESLTLPTSITAIEDGAFYWVRTVNYSGHLINWLRMESTPKMQTGP